MAAFGHDSLEPARGSAAVLTHPWDRPVEEAQWRAFLGQAGFGQLVAVGRGRDRAVVVPTQYHFDGETVRLHLARANPLWAALAENPVVTLSVAGDWAYIPGAWKAIGEEDPALGIPTTYYAAVQLSGPAHGTEDHGALAEVLRAQRAALEPQGGYADVEVHERRFAAIRGLVLHLSEMEVAAKFKYGGNTDDAHRSAVLARLGQRGGPGDRAAAGHVARTLAAPPPPARAGGPRR